MEKFTAMEDKSNYQKSGVEIPDHVSEPAILYTIRHNVVDSNYVYSLKLKSEMADELLSEALNINIKTFRSYKTKSISLKPHLQEQVVALLALYKHGEEVFGSAKKLNEWLGKSNYYFDNEKPFDFLSTISGIKHVDDRLSAIEFGDNV